MFPSRPPTSDRALGGYDRLGFLPLLCSSWGAGEQLHLRSPEDLLPCTHWPGDPSELPASGTLYLLARGATCKSGSSYSTLLPSAWQTTPEIIRTKVLESHQHLWGQSQTHDMHFPWKNHGHLVSPFSQATLELITMLFRKNVGRI